MRRARLIYAGYTALAIAFLVLSPATVNASKGSSEHTIIFEGQSRTYLLLVPDKGPSPRPALVLLHGGGSTAAGMERYSGFDEFAERQGIVAIYPDGISKQWNDRRRQGSRSSADDLGFIRALVQSLETQHLIDPRRVFVAGISNGGMMAMHIACNLPDMVAGIGIVAASQPTDATCPTPHPLPVIFMHGTADKLVPFEGGKIVPWGMVDRGNVVSDADTVAFWQKENGCGHATRETISPRVPDDGTTVRVETYSCPPGHGLVNVIIEGGGHTWPGARQTAVATMILGRASQNIDANEMMWRFFEAQVAPSH